jgi:hypothetical protein
MWAIAFAMYAVLKVGSLSGSPLRGFGRWAYRIAWPGMNPAEFAAAPPRPPAWTDWPFAVAKMAFGVGLILAVPSAVAGMVGLVFALHFGLFHLLALFWQSRGFHARPIMHWPILASSLADFWGKRWNLAFRDLTHRFLFRPLAKRFGATAGMAISFLVSGLIHELAITVPAGAGYGGPTIYFMAQGLGLGIERRFPRGLQRPFAILVVLVPVPLLFPAAFLDRIIAPFLELVTHR